MPIDIKISSYIIECLFSEHYPGKSIWHVAVYIYAWASNADKADKEKYKIIGKRGFHLFKVFKLVSVINVISTSQGAITL